MATEQNNSYCEIEVDDEITFRAPIQQKGTESIEISDKENEVNAGAVENVVSEIKSNATIPAEVMASSKMPTNLRSSWDLPSSISSQYSSKPVTSFTNAPVISNIRSRSSWEDATETTSKKPTVIKPSWDLPTNLTHAYGNSDEHLAKYSEAEHQTLLDNALAVLTGDHEKKMLDKETEWVAEKDILQGSILDLEKKFSENAGSSLKSEQLIQEAQQETMLSKMQTKALTHRVQALETELSETKAKHEEKLSLTAQETQQKLSANEGEMDRLQKDLVVGLTSKFELQMIEKDAEIKRLLKAVEDQASAQQLKEAKFEDTLNEAVAEAKKHVYAKAEAQFTAGNAKYQSVKQQLKDKQAELTTATAELDIKSTEVVEAGQTAKEAQDALVLLQAKHDVVGKEITQLVQAINEPSAVAAENRIINYSDFYGTKDAVALLAKRHLETQELVSKESELFNSKKLLESMIIEKETQIIQLTADKASLVEQLKDKEAQLVSSQTQLSKVEKESEFQLVIVAKLTTEKETVESKLREAEKEQAELTVRCTNLRDMNSELMTMLEANE